MTRRKSTFDPATKQLHFGGLAVTDEQLQHALEGCGIVKLIDSRIRESTAKDARIIGLKLKFTDGETSFDSADLMQISTFMDKVQEVTLPPPGKAKA